MGTKRKLIDLRAFALLIVGTLVWSITMVKSGLIYDYGMGFWGPNGHDGIWHVALIKNLAGGSFSLPVFSGESLANYHLGFDLLVAALHKLTSIPVVTLYFQVIPPILAFLIGYLTYKLVYLWKKSRLQALLATFFVYFGGSWGWVISFIRSGELGGESIFWSQQAISTLINPPFALSLVLLLLGTIFLLKNARTPTTSYFVLSVVTLGILIQIKVYAGLLVLVALLASGVYRYWKEKKKDLLGIFLGVFIVSLALFLPTNKDSVSLMVFKPFWFLETMMGFEDRLGWEKFYSAMTNYKLAGQWVKAVAAYTVAFIIFYYGNLGTRMVMEVGIANWTIAKKWDSIKIFFLTFIFAGTVVPMFFLQQGTPWNTIQFFYYSLFFAGILAGVVLGELLEIKKTGSRVYLLAIGLVLLTLPTALGTLKHYLPARPPAKLSHAELEALTYLSREPSGVVLTYPFDRFAAIEAAVNPPRPLYLYESTAYVAAFSGKVVYLEDEVNLDITGFNWQERRGRVETFLVTQDANSARKFLEENDIAFVYWVSGQRASLGEDELGLELIFENQEVKIYNVGGK